MMESSFRRLADLPRSVSLIEAYSAWGARALACRRDERKIVVARTLARTAASSDARIAGVAACVAPAIARNSGRSRFPTATHRLVRLGS